MGQTEDWRDKKTKVWEYRGQEGLRYFGFEEELENMSNQTKKEKSRSIWDRLTALSRYDKKVPPCECVATATWLKHGSVDLTRWARRRATKLAESKKRCTLGGRQASRPVGKIEDFVKHVFREHTQEGDHLANVVEGKRREELLSMASTTLVKASRGWDGSRKDNGSSGCGVVMRAFDRKNWITISKIVVPLKVCTAIAAELTGVNVLAEVLDLLLDKMFKWENVNECIDRILEDNGTERQ